MTLSQRTEMRRCGRPYASEEEALQSKRGRSGGFLAAFCVAGCRSWHLKRKPVTAGITRKPPKDTGPNAATRALVLARDGYACACCGRSVIGQRYSLQHRLRRSQGGTNSPVNLITVLGDGTTGCHARIDSRIDPDDEFKGYTVRSGQDPQLVGVMYFSQHGGGVTVWLEPDGGFLFEAPAGAA